MGLEVRAEEDELLYNFKANQEGKEYSQTKRALKFLFLGKVEMVMPWDFRYWILRNFGCFGYWALKHLKNIPIIFGISEKLSKSKPIHNP